MPAQGPRLSPRHSALSQDGSLQCPSCKTIYGEKTGTQPRGKMEVFTFQVSLPGHEDCGTILIVYNIPHGIQVRGPGTRGASSDLSGISPSRVLSFLSRPLLAVCAPRVTVKVPRLPSQATSNQEALVLGARASS